jgi:hypothetical protein
MLHHNNNRHSSRGLEDNYDYSTDDGGVELEQPHWYDSRSLWIVFVLLIVLSVGTCVYQLYYHLYQSRACRNMFAGARSATQDLVATDDLEAEAAQTSPKSASSPTWTTTKLEMAAPRRINHNDYVNMPTASTDLRTTGVPV